MCADRQTQDDWIVYKRLVHHRQLLFKLASLDKMAAGFEEPEHARGFLGTIRLDF